jgi:hypothetical protein
MKKSLFATTAIVAAFGFGSTAAQAQDASLSLSAFSNFYANWTDQDNPQQTPSASGAKSGGVHESDYDFSTNTEFEVNGELTLDNGITAGLSIEVEADNREEPADNIDENLIYLDGSFGRVELGHEDGASDTMLYGATSIKAVYVGTYNNTTGSLINYAGDAPVLAAFGDSGDNTKITYFTPRFAGFQAGVTHAPDSEADAVIPDRADDATTEHWEGGVNYVNSFNGFDVAASVTGTYFNDSPSTTLSLQSNSDAGVGNTPVVESDTSGGGDNFNVTVGGVVGFGGFEFGGSYGFGEIGGEDAMAGDVGVGYSTGPWSLSVTGFYSELETAGDDEHERYEINTGINYALGSGVSIFASGAFGEGDPAGDNADGSDNANEYVSLISGVGVSF